MRKLMACLVALAATAAANAAPLFTISNTTGQTLANPPFTLGFAFTATQGGTITALGLFDDRQDGLAESHAIGLWNSGGTLLASTNIPAGTAAGLTNQFRYVSIPTVNLTAGQQYVVGALYTSGQDPLIFPGFATAFATTPGITFNRSSFGFGGSLTFPGASAGGDPAYFGPNALFNIPEPISFVVFGGLVLGGAGVAFRRRMTAKPTA